MKMKSFEQQRQYEHQQKGYREIVGEPAWVVNIPAPEAQSKDSLSRLRRFKATLTLSSTSKPKNENEIESDQPQPRRNMYQLQEARQSVGYLLAGAASEMLRLGKIRKSVMSVFRSKSEPASTEMGGSSNSGTRASLQISQP